MLENGEYERALSRQYPGLFVILLDQSVSMNEKESEYNQTKASLVTRHVNNMIQNMIDFAGVDEYTRRHRNYAYLSVLGYNDSTYPLLSPSLVPVDIPTLEETPKGVVSSIREARDMSGVIVRRFTEKLMFWIEPKALGNTEMTRAFEEAERVVANWFQSSPESISREMGMQMPREKSFPPVVINITDAKHNGDGDPEEVAGRLRQWKSVEGNVLICNCHFTHERSESCVFPRDISEVEQVTRSKLALRMFSMSSVIPETLRERAQHIMRTPIERGARCFAYNADPDILVKFLRWTTLGNVGGKGVR